MSSNISDQNVRSRRPLHNKDEITANSSESDESKEYTQIKAKTSQTSSTPESAVSKSLSFVLLVGIFTASIGFLYLIYTSLPELDQDEKVHIKLPTSIEDAKQLGKVLTKYRKGYYIQVLSAYCLCYIFLQTFAIPGSIFLSIISGYLFPVYTALILVCTCSAVGATFCYAITSLIGRKIVIKYFPEKVESWCKQVDHHREHLLNYIIFLRITPFLPNWFINIASPVINVDLFPFTLGTFIGVAPPSFFAIQTGTTLYEMTESTSNFTWSKVAFLGILAVLSLLPVLFKKKLRSRLE